jgi:apolipoprotein N-acyltransferase
LKIKKFLFYYLATAALPELHTLRCGLPVRLGGAARVIELLRKYSWCLLSGVLLALSFQPAGLYGLAYIALVPLLVSLWGKEPGEAFTAGMTTGFAYFFGTLYWIYYSINHYGNIPFPVSIGLVILLSLFLSVYVGLFSTLFCQKIVSTRLPAAILAPIFWISFEYLRGVLFTGFPWASIAYSQYSFLPLVQIGDLAGIHGVGFVIAAVNGAIADIFIMRQRRECMPLFPARQVVLSSCLAVLLFLVVLAYGFWRLHEQRPGRAPSGKRYPGEYRPEPEMGTRLPE